MWQAGFDGVECVGSDGYLPAQFLNPQTNLREDGYGGSPENRLRFLREALAAMRDATDEDFIIGMRLSASDRDEAGPTIEDALAASRALQDQLDYLSLTVGTSASVGGAVHISAPMNFPAAHVAPEVARFKKALTIPIFATRRINQPQEAETMLARGEADVCGMTRALICDPVMPAKAEAGKLATGAVPYLPQIETDGAMQILDACDVLRRDVKARRKVVIADWRADWIGPELAELLSGEGSTRALGRQCALAGETIPDYVRDTMVGNLHRLGVEVILRSATTNEAAATFR